MSYFDDQMDAWFDGNCQGRIEDMEPYSEESPPDVVNLPRVKTEAQKEKKRRNRRRREAKRQAVLRSGRDLA